MLIKLVNIPAYSRYSKNYMEDVFKIPDIDHKRIKELVPNVFNYCELCGHLEDEGQMYTKLFFGQPLRARLMNVHMWYPIAAMWYPDDIKYYDTGISSFKAYYYGTHQGGQG